MEKNHSLLPEKSGSFSCREEKKPPETTRNLSMGAIKSQVHYGRNNESEERDQHRIKEKLEEEEEGEKKVEEDGGSSRDLSTISEEIDRFLGSLYGVMGGQNRIENPVDHPPPEVPDTVVEELAVLVEKEIAKYDVVENRPASPAADVAASFACQLDQGDFSLLEAIDRVSKLTTALGAFPSEAGYRQAINRTGAVLHRAMSFLEDEMIRSLLEEPKRSQDVCKWTPSPPPQQAGSHHDSDNNSPHPPPSSESDNEADYPVYPPKMVERLHRIASAMISAGYETECCQVFGIARRNAFEAGLSDLGFEKISIDDVQKLPWDELEKKIATWIKACRRSASVSFSHERDLCDGVFSGANPSVASGIFGKLARAVVIQLLNFAEAVAMTKRSAEKLFKFLDMYEALRDLTPQLDSLFSAGEEEEREEEGSSSGGTSRQLADLKSEISTARSRLGEAAVRIFSDLESSIKSDVGKTPMPGGDVHPLTRYVMNYLKYACEYKNTLEELFREQMSSPMRDDDDEVDDHNNSDKTNGGSSDSPSAAQLMAIMDMLDSNLESKSKLYKDLSLSYIFLMNNGRYIVQKIRGSTEINELFGETWCRKRSSDLRQYHKNYQRETWGKLLGCLKDEGMQVKGNVSKPVLKERLKSFNAMFEEIHKTQSSWAVKDDQLRSELRVSVSAVVVPAYRSFLGRFGQYLDAGRQSGKYIKFGPEDLETYIDELFDGNPASILRRRT